MSYVCRHGSQKRASDPPELELLYVCWESDSRPLEEQQAHLSAEPSLLAPEVLWDVLANASASRKARKKPGSA